MSKFDELSLDWLIKWRDALKSGKWTAYSQALHNMEEQNRNEACCLGVLDELHIGSKRNAGYPLHYPKSFNLVQFNFSDFPQELQEEITTYIQNLELDLLVDFKNLANLFACVNDLSFSNGLSGFAQYEQVISILEMIIAYKQKTSVQIS